MEKPTFTRLDHATKQDILQIVEYMQNYSKTNLPTFLLKLLCELKSDTAFPVNRLEHSLQTATRAYHDHASDELIAVALLHDIGEILSPRNHGEVIAAILRPYISEQHYWLLKHHSIFQGYYFWEKIGLDKNSRDKYRDHSAFELTEMFCEKWDKVSFDPNFKSIPLTEFEPLIYQLFMKEPNYSHLVEREF